MRFIGFVAPSDVPSQPEPSPPIPAIADDPSPESNDEIAFDALPDVVDRAVIAERHSKGQRQFVTLDLAVDKGTDTYGRSVMLAEMLMSYLMLGFMASLFSSIFPRSPD